MNEQDLANIPMEAAVHLNIPTFIPHNTRNWFLQLQAVFESRKITSQLTKFSKVVENLPPEMIDEIADLLDPIPTLQPYDTLKEAIIKRTGRSDQQMLKDFFNQTHMGDRSPTQLLRHMRNSLGNNEISAGILKSLWLDKLPTTMSQILATCSDNRTLDEIAEIADTIHNTYSVKVNAVTRPDDELEAELAVAKAKLRSAKEYSTPNNNNNNNNYRIEAELADIKAQLHAITRSQMQPQQTYLEDELADIRRQLQLLSTTPQRHRNFSRQPRQQRRSRSRSRGRRTYVPYDNDSDICWYHTRFGSRAKHCSSPCNYQNKAQGNDEFSQ